MQKDLTYTPMKCSMKECAFPNGHCCVCKANVSTLGSHAIKMRDPKANYTFIRKVLLRNI